MEEQGPVSFMKSTPQKPSKNKAFVSSTKVYSSPYSYNRNWKVFDEWSNIPYLYGGGALNQNLLLSFDPEFIAPPVFSYLTESYFQWNRSVEIRSRYIAHRPEIGLIWCAQCSRVWTDIMGLCLRA